MASGNVISISGGHKSSVVSPAHREVVNRCRTVLDQTMGPLLEGFLEKLDDKLYDLSDKSTNDALQTAYFTTLRDARKHTKVIQEVFAQSVLNSYDLFWGLSSASMSPSRDSQVDSGELTLVDEDDLEDTLALEKMVARGETAFHRDLYALNQRFSVITSTTIETEQNPVSPAVVCVSFQKAIEAIRSETSVRIIIYKLFEKHALRYLGGLYDDLNAVLEKSGVKADVADRARRNPIAPSVARHRNEKPEESQDIVEQQGNDAVAEVFKTLQQLLATQLNSSVAQQSSSVPVEPIQPSSLIGALNNLQSMSVMQAEKNQAINLKQELSKQLGVASTDLNSRALGVTESNTLDVISMLFEFVVEDKNLPDAMKALLGRLQIPMLKVALQDQEFFSSRNHPARRLLNDLASAAISWTDDGDRSENSLYGRVEAAVNDIVSNYEIDIAVFERAAHNFHEYSQRETRAITMTEKRTQQVNQGKEQLSATKVVVAKIIRRALVSQKDIPAVVTTLLKDGWHDVLLLIHLKQGAGSEDWENATKVIDRLLWSVQPKPKLSDRQKLLSEIPQLLRQLRAGLNDISYDQHKITSIFRELQVIHVACLKNKLPTVKTTTVDDIVDLEDSRLNDSTFESVSVPVEDTFLAMADKLDVKTWVEITDEENNISRVKLSWKSKFSDNWMFVNRKGMKALELTRNGVAMLFKDQRIKVIGDGDKPIMERAMNAMVSALKKDMTEQTK